MLDSEGFLSFEAVFRKLTANVPSILLDSPLLSDMKINPQGGKKPLCLCTVRHQQMVFELCVTLISGQ